MRISSIVATPLFLEFKEPYHWAGRVDYGASVVLVEVQTDDGVTGVGESTAAFPADGTVSALRDIAPVFVGQSAFDFQRLLDRARWLGSFNHTPRFANLALAGLEMALYDAIGKTAGWPLYKLLGGAVRDSVDYFGFVQGDTAEELAEDALALSAAAYSVIYMKVGRGEATDLRNVAAVREAIGDRRLRLDANGAWSVGEAIHMIGRLARFEPEWIEQPTSPLSVSALRQVKEAVGVPIAADQSVFTLGDVYEVCCRGAADAIVLSPHETGGLHAFGKAAAVAEAAGISVCLHGQCVSGITDAAQHHAGLAAANLTDGNQIMHQLIVEDLVATPDLTPQGGSLGLLDGPGIGIELDRDAVARAAERCRLDSRALAAFRLE